MEATPNIYWVGPTAGLEVSGERTALATSCTSNRADGAILPQLRLLINFTFVKNLLLSYSFCIR